MTENVLARAVLLSSMAGLLSSCLLRGQTYSVVDLGVETELPGGNESKPNGINFQGDVAGANVIGGVYQAVVFAGAWTNLGTLGGSSSYAAGINDSNLVVGHSLTADGSDHGFLWIPGGAGGVSGNAQMIDLGTLGGSASEAYGINRSGQISGYTTDAAGNIHCFLYSQGGMTDISGSLPANLPSSYGYGINNSGHIAGTAYNSSYTVEHAFFYNGTTSADLGSLGQAGASALALNDNDQVVGYATTKGQLTHAFVYAGGQMVDLGTLGGNNSYAIGINNSNVVVGGSNFDPTQTATHAFMAVSNSMIDLNSLLALSGSGWTLTEARVISDSGLIAGTGVFGGANHMFLLRPVSSLQPPLITEIETAGADVIVQFTTGVGSHYALESGTNLLTGNWADVVTNIVAASTVTTVTNAGGATLDSRFYRVSLVP